MLLRVALVGCWPNGFNDGPNLAHELIINATVPNLNPDIWPIGPCGKTHWDELAN